MGFRNLSARNWKQIIRQKKVVNTGRKVGKCYQEGSWEVFMCKALFHEKTFKNCSKAMDKYSRFLVVCLRFPKEPGMYQLGTVSLGAGSRMDLVPVWWGGEGEKGTLLSKSSPQYPGGCPGSLQSQPGVLWWEGRLGGALCYSPF